MKNVFKLIRNKKSETYVVIVLLLILLYFPVFSFLGTLPMRIWDESRLAISAIEMAESGNLIETTYQSEPDLWNSKPPTMIWFQALSIKVFGINEFAVRFPSAVFAFITCILLFLFTIRYSGNIWFAAIAVMLLITSQGYISIHGTRTADYDSLLALNVAAYVLCFFHFFNTGNKKYYHLFFLFLTLAVLTKGIAGFLFLPGIFIFMLINRKLLPLFKMRESYLGVLFLLVLVGGYYIARELLNPGYIKAVLYNEITGRYLTDLENHKEPFAYYFTNLINSRYTAYVPWLLLAMFGNFFIKDEKLSKLSEFCTINLISFLLIISTGVSKMEHYELPIYPVMAITIGIFIYSVFILLERVNQNNLYFKYSILPIAFIFMIFYGPYVESFKKNVKPVDEGWGINFYSLGYALKKIIKNPKEFDELSIVHSGYNAHIEFYRHMLLKKGIKSEYIDIRNAKGNTYAVVPTGEELNNLPSDLKYEEIYTEKFAKVVKIIKYKSFNEWLPESTMTPVQNTCYSTCSPWQFSDVHNQKTGEKAITVFADFETGMDCDEFKKHVDSNIASSGKTSVYTSADNVFSASFHCYAQQFEKYDIIEISGKVFTPGTNVSAFAVYTHNVDGNNVNTIQKNIFSNGFTIGTWNEFRVYFNPKAIYPKNSELLMFIHSNSGDKLNFDDLRITFMKSTE